MSTSNDMGLHEVINSGLEIVKSEFTAKMDDLIKENETLKTELEDKSKEFTERLSTIETSFAKSSHNPSTKKSMFQDKCTLDFLKTLSKNPTKAHNDLLSFEKDYTKEALGYQSNVWDSNGTLCPEEFESTIMDLIYNDPNNGRLLSMVNNLTSTAKSNVYFVETRPPVAVRTEEAEPAVFSKMKYGRAEITSRKMTVAFTSTWESQEYSRIDVQQRTTSRVAGAFRDLMCWELLHGEKNQGLEGILRNNNIDSFPSSVSKAFSIDDLFDMSYSMNWGSNPAFVMHKKTFGWLRKQKNDIKDYYNAFDITDAAIPRINGIPVILLTDIWVDDTLLTALPYKINKLNNVKVAEATLTSLLTPADLTAGQTPFVGGDIPVLFTDLSTTYTKVNSAGMRSMVDPYSMSLTDQTRFLFHMSSGGAVINPKATLKLQIKA